MEQRLNVSLAGKVLLLTGASSGIGAQTARLTSQLGATVIGVGRDLARLDAVHGSLAPGQHQMFSQDLTDLSALPALVKRLPKLDGLVLAAGIPRLAPLHLLSSSLLDQALDINLKSPVLLIQQCLQQKKLQQGASIVLLSSIAAHTGTEGTCAYSLSKAALEGFMRPAALELARKQMRINAIASAMVQTPIGGPDDRCFEPFRDRYPLGLGEPEDVAAAAVFLVSDASRYMTGSTLVMDGGSTWV